MTSYAQRFYSRSAKTAGNPTDLYDLDEATQANTTTTTATFTSTTAATVRVTPFKATSTGVAVPAVGAAASNVGWRLPLLAANADNGEPRVILAGQYQLVLSATTGTYALLAASPSYVVTAIAYKIGTGGASTEIGRGTSTVTVAATTTQTFTAVFNLGSDVTLQPGETIQVEFYFRGQATANALNQVTNNTVIFNVGAQTGINLPADLVTVATRTGMDTAPTSTDTATRTQTDVRRSGEAESVPVDSTSRLVTTSRIGTGTLPLTDSATSSETYPRTGADAAAATSDTALRTQTDYRRATDALQLIQDVATRRTADFRRAAANLDVVLGQAFKLVTYGRSVRHQFSAGDDPLVDPTRWITGTVRTSDNIPYAGASVYLVRDDDVVVAETTSAADGSYAFARNSFDSSTYYVAAFTDGPTPREGVTERGLVPA